MERNGLNLCKHLCAFEVRVVLSSLRAVYRQIRARYDCAMIVVCLRLRREKADLLLMLFASMLVACFWL